MALGEFLFTDSAPPPPEYLRFVWCLRLGITGEQFDAQDARDWQLWEMFLAEEARYKKRLRWE